MNLPSPIEPARQRASDADRELVATALGEAYASGRLTEAEHAERLDAAFAARTLGELEPLTRDLQPSRPASPALATAPRRSVAAFSKVIRHDRSVLPASGEALSLCGALVLDLREASVPPGGATIAVSAYLGKVLVLVPDDAEVEDRGTALFGKRSLLLGAPSEPGRPVLRLHGRAVLGKVRVVRGGGRGRVGW